MKVDQGSAVRIVQDSVCAVMVTFHPNAAMLEHLADVLTQTHSLVVVDNGSSVTEISALKQRSHTYGFRLIENGENLGIAEALNRGVKWARERGYAWVLLFDQDSRLTANYVTQLMKAFRSHPSSTAIASMHPRYLDKETGIEPHVRRAADGGPIVSLTSGALMPTWIFDKIGYFASNYFIDQVDIEYCFRIRAAGYLVADSREATLLHNAGHPQRLSILGFSFQPSHHNAIRRYYITRNRIAVSRRYFLIFPCWILQSMNESFRETIKCFLAEQDKTRKFRYFLLGAWDGLIGKMGRRDGL